MERLSRTLSGKLIRLLPSGEMLTAPIVEFSIGWYGNFSKETLNEEELSRLQHAIANCSSCHGSTKTAWKRINDGRYFLGDRHVSRVHTTLNRGNIYQQR